MSRARYLLVPLAFLFALPAFADTLPAGFTPASLWLSKSALSDGDTAHVSTALYDSGDTSLSGDLIFTDNGTTFANVPFSLAAGESKIYSASWTAKGGSHTLGAALANVKSGSGAASVRNASSASIAIDVAEPAPPSPALSAATSTLGAATNAATAAFGTAESVRTAGAKALENELASLGTTTGGGKVLGASTENPAAVGAAGSDWLRKAEAAALTALLFVFNSQFWFYLLALVALYLVYKVIRVAFADRRHRYR